MDFSLNRQQTTLVRQVRDLAARELQARKGALASGEEYQSAFLEKLAGQNLVCPTVPTEYGGLGLDRFSTALVMEEIAAADPGVAAVIAATLHAAEPIILAGSEEQKRRFLPGLTGAKAGVAAFALTEPTGGSNLSALRTCAVKTDEAYYLNGGKDYVLNAGQAAWITLVASTVPEPRRTAIRIFLVPADTPGLKTGQRRYTSGLEYARIGEILFANARVEEENVIRSQEAGSGYLLLAQTFDRGRAMVGAISVGIARAALEEALTFAEEREQFGTALKNHQAIAFALADMATRVEMARLMTWKACWLIDRGEDYSTASAMAKLSASEIAQQVTTQAADIFGARGYERGYFIEQLVRDARVLSTIEGTNNIQRLFIASQL